MRALVTGCAGFVGSHLTESLLADGCSVVGVDCFNNNYGRPQKLANIEHAREWDEFDFVPIDLGRGELHDLVADCDVVYHLAAEPQARASWGERFEAFLRNNVLATQHLLEAAARFPETRFVYASSSSVYGQAERLPTGEDVVPMPFSPYGTTKLAGEHLCQAYRANYGVDTVILRYFSVYGPRQRPDMAFNRFCFAALRGESIPIYGDGSQTRDFTYVGDVVAATRSAAQLPAGAGGTYNVGGGARKSLIDAVALIAGLAGRELELQRLPSQEGDVRDTGADTELARSVLGFKPGTEFEEGLRAEFEWARRTLVRASG
jgi:UDP-glucuronate 4-epimerase